MDHQVSNAPSMSDQGGVARPSLARKPLSIRLSEQELRAVIAAASACGQEPSVFIRRAAMSAAGRPVSATVARRDALAQETAKAIGHLGRIGSLFNQVARIANSGRLGAADAAYAYGRAARELASLRQALITQNGD
ncbi:uncharacterized protein (DUF1778 family) [Rhodoblastus acidophilus]|uniref:plasmid mobilization protein n=1 Tax=Rhodoblastus acidophilus TaxID=1074 RepID=UPI002224790D|nr:hypothetical protein [Rhodoblastus acidophilus]MCW2283158.1 uncharacterized protein (DUF1778 family) [Rhodoblastus acidophilus]MCW2332019.1 uncharacterized protein (DUF1778 family) [Rhodoblastus acidophilus]